MTQGEWFVYAPCDFFQFYEHIFRFLKIFKQTHAQSDSTLIILSFSSFWHYQILKIRSQFHQHFMRFELFSVTKRMKY